MPTNTRLRVIFKCIHPDKTFDDIMIDLTDTSGPLHEGSIFADKMSDEAALGNLLPYGHRWNPGNGEYCRVTYWKDKASNDAFTAELNSTPAMHKFYDNLTANGYTYEVVKAEVEVDEIFEIPGTTGPFPIVE